MEEHKHSPLDQFRIHPIYDFHVAGYDLSFTNSSLLLAIALIGICAFLLLGMRQRALIPGRWQSMSEAVYEFVANHIVRDNLGPEGRKFVPIIFTLFISIVFLNVLGMIPGSFTATSHIAVTFALAMVVFLTVTIYGFVKHGFHFLSLFVPKGMPLWMLPIMVPTEVVSFLARPLSLSLRLAANMIAGHILLKVFASFVIALGILGGIFPLAFMVFLVGFEIFICILQAYIFSLLSTIYLNDAIHLH